MTEAHNGLLDMAQTVRVKGLKLEKKSWVAIWQLSDNNQVGILLRKEPNA